MIAMMLYINGRPTDEYFCQEHNKWNWAGDECNCCIEERENKWMEENRKIFVINDANDEFYEVTTVIPDLIKYWSLKYNDPNFPNYDFAESYAIERLMLEMGCNRYIIGYGMEDCVNKILNREAAV
jgi:hypothetical protein